MVLLLLLMVVARGYSIHLLGASIGRSQYHGQPMSHAIGGTVVYIRCRGLTRELSGQMKFVGRQMALVRVI